MTSHIKTSSLVPEGKNNNEHVYSSEAYEAIVDIETHCYGLRGKLGMFKSTNVDDQEMLQDVLEPCYYALEFEPNNPIVNLKHLSSSESVQVKVPRVLWLSGHRQPATIPFTSSHDQKGNYHAAELGR